MNKMNKIAFIIHGRHKEDGLLKEKIKNTFRPPFEPSFFYTEYAQHSISLTEQAIREGSQFIICCGGDGSLNECMNGIMNSGTQNETVLGVLPMGTGNDFIKTAGSPKDLVGLKKLIENNQSKRIDLGLAEFKTLQGQPISRYFINITDVGMGGVVAEKLSRSKKRLGSFLTYQMSIVSSLMAYHKQVVLVEGDSFKYQGHVMNLIVANGRYFGSGLGVAPDALVDDGLLDVVVLGDLGLKDYIRYQPAVGRCEKIDHPEIKYFKAKEIKITSPGRELPIDMDGEFVGYSPLQIKILPEALSFLA